MTARMDRRSVLKIGAVAGFGLAAPPSLFAQSPSRHGLSVFGELKYPSDFKRFDYINANAPKGGRIVFTAPNWNFNQNPQTFNTLNPYTRKGDGPPRIEYCFDTLMVPAVDEPDSIYGLLAESVSISDDGNVYVFRLRRGARFHDKTPVTAEDVAFSLMLIKEKGHPSISIPVREMAAAEATGEREVTVTLSGKQDRKMILTVASVLPIFSKRDLDGKDFEKSTLTPLLSSGPYRVGALEPGRFIE